MTGSGAHGGQGSGGRTFSRWAVLLTVLVMTFMVCLDSSIVTVALPVMQKELGVGIDQIQWVSSVYLISTCVGVLPFGRLGDLRGKVYVFQAGVVIFEAFPQRELGRAMGLLATFVSLGMMAGPVLGGIIVSTYAWEGIFLINVPVGIASFMVGLRTLPHVRPSADAACAHSMLGSARLCFSNPTFAINLLSMLIVFMGIGSYEFVLPFYFQDAHGLSAGVSSLLFMVLPVVNAVVGPISGSVSDRVGCEVPTCVGLGVYVAGLLAASTLDETSPIWLIVCFVGLISMGNSIFQAPNNSLFMASAPTSALGFAGSVSSLARYAGMAVGISSASAMLYGRMGQAAGHAVTGYVDGRPDVFLAGFSFVFYVLAAVAAVGLVLTLVRLVLSRREG